jgi:hypothetical protein
MMLPFDDSQVPINSAIDSKRESGLKGFGGGGPVSERSKKIVYQKGVSGGGHLTGGPL